MKQHELFSVWKENPVVTPSTPWKLQMPNGILSFRTKRKATAVADNCKRPENAIWNLLDEWECKVKP